VGVSTLLIRYWSRRQAITDEAYEVLFGMCQCSGNLGLTLEGGWSLDGTRLSAGQLLVICVVNVGTRRLRCCVQSNKRRCEAK
jgi:hypothetical protein